MNVQCVLKTLSLAPAHTETDRPTCGEVCAAVREVCAAVREVCAAVREVCAAVREVCAAVREVLSTDQLRKPSGSGKRCLSHVKPVHPMDSPA